MSRQSGYSLLFVRNWIQKISYSKTAIAVDFAYDGKASPPASPRPAASAAGIIAQQNEKEPGPEWRRTPFHGYIPSEILRG